MLRRCCWGRLTGRRLSKGSDRTVFPCENHQVISVRRGSNELDGSSSPEKSSAVMLSAAEHLCVQPARCFAALSMTRCMDYPPQPAKNSSSPFNLAVKALLARCCLARSEWFAMTRNNQSGNLQDTL